MVSAKRALAGYGHLQLRRKCRSHSRSAQRALGNDPLRTALRVPRRRRLQRGLDFLVVEELPQTDRSSHAHWRRTPSHLQRRRDPNGSLYALDPAARISPDLGFLHREIPDRPYLVVLSLLAAILFQCAISSQSLSPRPAAHSDLQHVRCRQHRRRLAARALSQTRIFGCWRAPRRPVLLRVSGRPRFHHWASAI